MEQAAPRIRIHRFKGGWRFRGTLHPANVFVFWGVLFHLLLAAYSTPFFDYPHQPERFMRVASLAHMLARGESDALPRDYLAYAHYYAGGRVEAEMAASVPTREMLSELRNELHADRDKLRQFCPHERTDFHFATTRCLARYSWDGEKPAIPFRSSNLAGNISPFGYVGFLPGMVAGMWLGISPPITTMLSYAGNIALCLWLGWFALRIVPYLRWPLLFLFLMPSMFSMRYFFMPDGLLVMLCALLVAMVLKMRQWEAKISWREVAELLLLSVGVGLVKIFFFLMPAVVCLIPARRFSSTLRRFLLLAACVGGSLLAAMSWNLYSVSHYKTVRLDIATMWDTPYKSPATVYAPGIRASTATALSLMNEPLRFLRAMWVNVSDAEQLNRQVNNLFFWSQYLGGGKRIHPLAPLWLLSAYLALLFVLAAMDRAGEKAPALSAREKSLVVGVILATTLMIAAVVFLFWGYKVTAGGREYVHGMQGRYFLPLFPLIYLLFRSSCLLPGVKWEQVKAGGLMVLVALTGYLHYLYLSRLGAF